MQDPVADFRCGSDFVGARYLEVEDSALVRMVLLWRAWVADSTCVCVEPAYSPAAETSSLAENSPGSAHKRYWALVLQAQVRT